MNIEQYFNREEIFQYKLIRTNLIPFSQDVAKACRSNQCGKYGTCWTCPPAVGSITQLEKKIKSYDYAVVFTCKHSIEDWFDIEGMTEAAQKTENILRVIVNELKQAQTDFFALGCEGCSLCTQCTYPNAPCRFPDKAFISVEACGINVVELSQSLGIKYNNGINTVTYFCIILLGDSNEN